MSTNDPNDLPVDFGKIVFPKANHPAIKKEIKLVEQSELNFPSEEQKQQFLIMTELAKTLQKEKDKQFINEVQQSAYKQDIIFAPYIPVQVCNTSSASLSSIPQQPSKLPPPKPKVKTEREIEHEKHVEAVRRQKFTALEREKIRFRLHHYD